MAKSRCFALLGFDLMLDSQLKPWLLEINHMPSLRTDTNVDREVKVSNKVCTEEHSGRQTSGCCCRTVVPCPCRQQPDRGHDDGLGPPSCWLVCRAVWCRTHCRCSSCRPATGGGTYCR